MLENFSINILYRFSDNDEFEQLGAYIVQNNGLFFAHISGLSDPLKSDSIVGLGNEIRSYINPKKRQVDIRFETPGQDAIEDIVRFWDLLH